MEAAQPDPGFNRGPAEDCLPTSFDLRAEFASKYTETVKLVFSLILRRVGNRAVAEELTHDTFQSGWVAFARFDSSRSKFLTWVLQIAENEVKQYFRSQRARKRRGYVVSLDTPRSHSGIGGDVDGALVDRRTSQPGDKLIDDERLAAFNQALEALDPSSATLVRLHLAGLSQAEIAFEMGKSVGAVNSAFHRIKARLGAALTPFAP